MRRLAIHVLALLLALAWAAVFAVEGAAADTPSGATVNLKLNSPTVATANTKLTLTVTLAGPDGKPLSNRSVDFYQQVQLLGTREAYLGSALTDSTGTATLAYQPAESGKQTIAARFAGEEGYAQGEAVSTIDVTRTAALFPAEPLPLLPLGRWLIYGVGLLVLATWVVLLSLLAGTALGIRATASPQSGRAPAWLRRLGGVER